jgi:hypothetical protein
VRRNAASGSNTNRLLSEADTTDRGFASALRDRDTVRSMALSVVYKKTGEGGFMLFRSAIALCEIGVFVMAASGKSLFEEEGGRHF